MHHSNKGLRGSLYAVTAVWQRTAVRGSSAADLTVLYKRKAKTCNTLTLYPCVGPMHEPVRQIHVPSLAVMAITSSPVHVSRQTNLRLQRLVRLF